MGQADHLEENSQHKSFLWRSLIKVLPDFKKGTGWSIKNGNLVSFWKDSWLIDEPLVEHINNIPPEHIDKKVAAYVTSSGEWNWELLERLLPQDLLLRLSAVKINREEVEEDTLS